MARLPCALGNSPFDRAPDRRGVFLRAAFCRLQCGDLQRMLRIERSLPRGDQSPGLWRGWLGVRLLQALGGVPERAVRCGARWRTALRLELCGVLQPKRRLSRRRRARGLRNRRVHLPGMHRDADLRRGRVSCPSLRRLRGGYRDLRARQLAGCLRGPWRPVCHLPRARDLQHGHLLRDVPGLPRCRGRVPGGDAHLGLWLQRRRLCGVRAERHLQSRRLLRDLHWLQGRLGRLPRRDLDLGLWLQRRRVRGLRCDGDLHARAVLGAVCGLQRCFWGLPSRNDSRRLRLGCGRLHRLWTGGSLLWRALPADACRRRHPRRALPGLV